MTGYLGRLWSASATRQPALRPMAGSIYAASPAAAPEPFAADHTPREQHITEVPERDARREAPSILPGRGQRTTAEQEPQAPASVWLRDDTPLLPQRQPGAVPSALPGSVIDTGMSLAPRSSPPMAPMDAGEVKERRDTAIGAPILCDAHQPNRPGSNADHGMNAVAPMSEPPRVPEPRVELQSASQPQTPVRPPLQPLQPRIANPPLRDALHTPPAPEPDVQIHIGRIEVIAAVPAAPRAPQPRQNRTTSLADYLSRRNGNSR